MLCLIDQKFQSINATVSKIMNLGPSNNHKNQSSDNLYRELSVLKKQSRNKMESYANTTMVGVFWHVGKRINEHILQNKRAKYAKEGVPTLSPKLTEKFGSNFEEKDLR